MTKAQIRTKIFETLKEMGRSNHNGLLIVYSDIVNILRRGTHPLGARHREFKEYNEIGNINDKDIEKIKKILKKVGIDGAVLIDKKGNIYSPAVYLNVNLFAIDEKQIEPEFCARHIAALATSASTKASVYTLSEETGKVREFFKGRIKRKHPFGEQERILKILEKDLKLAKQV